MRRTLILATFMVAGSLHATQPTVAAIQDATGFKGLPVGTGKLASIYGTNLANVTEDTTGNPYPNIVSGTSVQFGTSSGWEYAPLVYLSPTQLNVQIPWTLDLTGQVIVTSPYGTADFSGPGASYEGWNYTASPSYYLNNGTPIITLQNGTLYTGQALASGSYVSLWINGGGQTSPDQTTGYVDSGLAWFQAGDFDYYVYYSSSENAIIGGTAPYCASGPNIVYDCATGSAVIRYAGESPGYLVLGQINLELPTVTQSGTMYFAIALVAPTEYCYDNSSPGYVFSINMEP